ncbi:hypothetical protein GJ744_001463 [Endocarpon pusillum]|uniref:Uncharacterized protein n=1 Tax=Endocarpon pusillum TaxID=364733 RepID=A0A8H7ANT2_9EURO|nr:hypothetical protein GJ744_001463 [Endocarpon pusillum]
MTSCGTGKTYTIEDERSNEPERKGGFEEADRMLAEWDKQLLQQRTAAALASGFSSLAEMKEHEMAEFRGREEQHLQAMEKRATLEGKTVEELIAELDYPQRDSPRLYLDTGKGGWNGSWDYDCEELLVPSFYPQSLITYQSQDAPVLMDILAHKHGLKPEEISIKQNDHSQITQPGEDREGKEDKSERQAGPEPKGSEESSPTIKANTFQEQVQTGPE